MGGVEKFASAMSDMGKTAKTAAAAVAALNVAMKPKRPVKKKRVGAHNPSAMSSCQVCRRHYPRKFLLVGRAAEEVGSPQVVACGGCVKVHAAKFRARGFGLPAAKRLAVAAKGCAVYDQKMRRGIEA